MKQTRRLALLLTTSLLAFPALAASATMLQFGSFESREQAERHLNDVKAKHAASLAGLSLSVREVQLPPNGITVYRTQAGPVASRPFAQTVCTKFAAKGDECYIVQTAMTTPAKPPEPAPEQAAAASPPPPSPEATPSVFTQAEAQATPPAPPETHEAEPESFWSRLNPFTDKESDKRTPEPIMNAAPAPALPEPTPEVIKAAAQEMQTTGEMPPLALANNAPPAPPLTEAELMQLPPPPEPLTPMALPTPMPANPAPAEPLVTGSLTPAPLPPPAPMPLPGHVSVEEAERVPVSEVPPPPAPATPPAIVEAPLAPPVPAAPSPSKVQAPSATTGQKTLWAQMGPFSNGQQAIQFWANYRMSHPDFPVVRVRVTSPYQQKPHGNREFWLRIGPMERASSVDNLCTSLEAMNNIRCGQVVDMGIAAAAGKPAGTLPGSRYTR